MIAINPTCRMFDLQTARWDFSFARPSAGRSIAARIAIIAITTSNSINVKPSRKAVHRACIRVLPKRRWLIWLDAAAAGIYRSFPDRVGAYPESFSCGYWRKRKNICAPEVEFV